MPGSQGTSLNLASPEPEEVQLASAFLVKLKTNKTLCYLLYFSHLAFWLGIIEHDAVAIYGNAKHVSSDWLSSLAVAKDQLPDVVQKQNIKMAKYQNGKISITKCGLGAECHIATCLHRFWFRQSTLGLFSICRISNPRLDPIIKLHLFCGGFCFIITGCFSPPILCPLTLTLAKNSFEE